MNIKASLEIKISPDRSDIFELLKNAGLNNGLKYDESATAISSDSLGVPSHIISKNIKFVTAVSVIATFLVQIQPTIQELIKANASKGITVTCGDKKIEIKGENDIEKAISSIKQLDCDAKK